MTGVSETVTGTDLNLMKDTDMSKLLISISFLAFGLLANDKKPSLRSKLRTIKPPKFEATEVTILESFTKLVKVSKEFDPEKTGIQIKLEPMQGEPPWPDDFSRQRPGPGSVSLMFNNVF